MRLLIAGLSMLIATVASAAPVDLNTPLLGQDGKQMVECTALNAERTKCEQETPMTVGLVCRVALDLAEEKLASGDIVKRGTLSEKIKSKDQIEFSVDEAKLIKDQLVKLKYPTLIKFQVIKIIDPKSIEDVK